MKTVLVIDDEPDIASGLKELFELEGYSVATASNGKLGLQHVVETRPNLVFLDLMMPIMTGEEVLEAISERPAGETVLIVVMSAADESRAAASFGCPFLRKPFEPAEVLGLAARLLTGEKA